MVESEVRNRLESTPYRDLSSMMESYAQAAAELGGREYRRELDYSAASIDALDEIMVLVGENPECNLNYEVRLWGSYLGEVLRRRYAGSWQMAAYPGESLTAPAVDVRGTLIFPLRKVFRRLTLGEEMDLQGFFMMVTERLGDAAKVN
jgi:hypothetical protein